MRRHLEIFLKFTAATGHLHPHLQVAPGNYLVRVAVETDLGTFEKTRTLAIAY